jgi:hypothetical protein
MITTMNESRPDVGESRFTYSIRRACSSGPPILPPNGHGAGKRLANWAMALPMQRDCKSILQPRGTLA